MTSPSAQIDAAHLAAKTLAAAGITAIFGVVGIPVTSLATRAVTAGIRFLAFHNEQAAGYAASAYGYLTATPGILLTVSGPGCVHGLAGLSNSAINCWPMIMISGSCDQRDFGRGDFQELDQLSVVAPFSKVSVRVRDVKEIPGAVVRVLEAAVEGRPGGCYLDWPTDVLHQTIGEHEIKKMISQALKLRGKDEKGVVEKGRIEEVARTLRRARRPLVVFIILLTSFLESSFHHIFDVGTKHYHVETLVQ